MGSPLHTPTSRAQGSQRPHLHPSTGFLTGVKRVNMFLKRRVCPEPWRPSRGSPAPGSWTRQPGRGVCCVAPDLTQYPFRPKPQPEDKPTCEFCPSSCYLAGGTRSLARGLPSTCPAAPAPCRRPGPCSPPRGVSVSCPPRPGPAMPLSRRLQPLLHNPGCSFTQQV